MYGFIFGVKTSNNLKEADWIKENFSGFWYEKPNSPQVFLGVPLVMFDENDKDPFNKMHQCLFSFDELNALINENSHSEDMDVFNSLLKQLRRANPYCGFLPQIYFMADI